MPDRNHSLRKFTDAELKHSLANGMSVPDIAMRFQCSKVAVYRRIRELNGTQVPRKNPEYQPFNGRVTRLKKRDGESDQDFAVRVEQARLRKSEYSKRYNTKPETLAYFRERYQKIRNDPDIYRKALDWHNAYRRQRSREDPSYKLSLRIRGRLRAAFAGYKQGQSWSTKHLVGCEIEELVHHLEAKFQPGMTRFNHGDWEIDHVIPLAYFDLNCPLQRVLAGHFTNLQPLWKADNRQKKHPDPALGIPKRSRKAA